MSNGHGLKEYGGHKYADPDKASHCRYGCGCWMGPVRSGGPAGLDPFGTCPGNPKDGNFLGGTADYEFVVNERIQRLTSRLHDAEIRLNQLSPSETELLKKLDEARNELATKNRALAQLRRIIDSVT